MKILFNFALFLDCSSFGVNIVMATTGMITDNGVSQAFIRPNLWFYLILVLQCFSIAGVVAAYISTPVNNPIKQQQIGG